MIFRHLLIFLQIYYDTLHELVQINEPILPPPPEHHLKVRIWPWGNLKHCTKTASKLHLFIHII